MFEPQGDGRGLFHVIEQLAALEVQPDPSTPNPEDGQGWSRMVIFKG